MKTYENMSRERLGEILAKISTLKAGLLGDICLDVYWHADMRKSELSRETPHYPLPVVKERMSPGGGANVVANMAALEPEKVWVFGAIGDDWRGRELVRLLEGLGAEMSGVITGADYITNTYIKPLRKGFSDVVYEDPRLDFTSYDPLPVEIEEKLLMALDETAAGLDILCVSDQMPFGVISDRVREYICMLAGKGLRVVVDSRYHIGRFIGCTIKPNELEGAKAAGIDPAKLHDMDDFVRTAEVLTGLTGEVVFMTLGEQGSIIVDAGQAWHIPARKIDGPIDIVGAGDSSLSGFGLALAAGAKPYEAAYIAGLCSGVTIQQVGVTGTASRMQILDWYI